MFNNKVLNMLAHKKWIYTFLRIKDGCNTSSLTRHGDTNLCMTYSHIQQNLSSFTKSGLLKITYIGRDNVINLTDKGIKLQKLLKTFCTELDK